MENLLNIRNLTMSFGTDLLYEDVGFGVSTGERIALVGPNGCGKSTLFELLVGNLMPDTGEIVLRGDTTVAYLAQQENFAPQDTPRDVVARAMLPVRRAIEEHSRLSERLSDIDEDADDLQQLLERQATLQERIQKGGGWSWEHRVEEMLDRFGVTSWIDEPVRRLSGGQRRRVDLARVLLEAPDLLLLDEPTNHLDTTAVEWLESWLIDHATTLIFVTHDRFFLERIADRILEIDDQFYDYPGNYQTFMKRKLHRQDVRRKTRSRKQKLLKKELQWLKGGVKSQNKRSKQRIDDIEQLRRDLPDRRERDVEMPLAEPGDFSDTILSIRGIWKSHGDLELLQSAHLDLRPGDKLGIIGPNGCGKSTLLEILAGEQRYEAGTLEKGKLTDIAFLRQHHLDVDPDTTVLEAVGESHYVWIGDTRYHRRDYLALYLLDYELQKAPVRTLSGGQRRRLAIARTFAKNPNVLLLDEPTNDLDILSLEALEESLQNFDGCVVAVSHDRYFLNRVCSAIVAFEDRKLQRYEGNYDDYRKSRDYNPEISRLEDGPSAETTRPQTETKTQKNREPQNYDGPASPLSWAEKQELRDLEDAIDEAEQRLHQLEQALSDPELYESRLDDLEPLNRELRDTRARLETLLGKWSRLEERRQR